MKKKNKSPIIAPKEWKSLSPFSASLSRLLAVYKLQNNENEEYTIIEDIVITENGISEHAHIKRRPLLQDEVNKIVAGLDATKEDVYQGIIPENVIYSDPFMQKYVWWVPPIKVKVNHSMNEWKKGCEFVFPALVMMQKDSLYVMGYDGDKRPTENTQLHALVLPNYDNSNGWNCLSQSIAKQDSLQELVDARTMQFYTWRFNSWAHSYESKKIRDDAYNEYTRERKKNDLSFDISKLPKSCKIREFINIT